MIHRTPPQQLTSIAILGLGRSGMAAYALAKAHGLAVCVHDDSVARMAEIETADRMPPESWRFEALDAVVISPGIAHSHPAPHPAAQLALDHQVPLISEIELAIHLQAPSKWVAITGTNGKSTTTALTAHILNKANMAHIVGGNLGAPIASLPAPAGQDGQPAVRIVEISSYQLEITPSLRPDIAVILNITPDHLARHGGMAGYMAAKEEILAHPAKGGVAFLGTATNLDEMAANHAHCQRLDIASVPASIDENLALSGEHNLENAAAAVAIARHLGVAEDVIAKALADFPGLPHRLQPIAQTDNHLFINDSKATNGEAAARALAAFDNIIWLAGGEAKEDGIEPCQPYFKNLAAAYLYGQDRAAFASALEGSCDVHQCKTLAQAFEMAMAHSMTIRSHKPQPVILSPAAASFDQFTSFEARGDAFGALVEAWLNTHDNKEAV